MADLAIPGFPLTVGETSGLALFVLALGVLLWPLGRRALEARRQRARELRIASGHGVEQRK